ncbi:SMP-30/gluconolaconase/LRE domain-containing protein [Tepidicaulis marinus]|uniref:SMP-30/gluconolaconase/LRE domain-containing protein n=1 Tax=Tepidicaulis marinus TaxID=1333998 RepID=A0A081B9X5_9HYPH|nr:SMP-30/gluconolactonase/LRE family protein [Tepidicaulis marinus]GAK44843.1 SMP-30/gluconolaconase/LRE domain-containing protein [Tepidicaulis marinus]
MLEMEEIASGLKFPEGPIAMDDGSVILVEIERGTLSRVSEDGKVEVIADLGGGPNGAAIGPDGAVYVCNNGGFEWHHRDGLTIPGDIAPDYSGGRIERVDLATGKVDTLYTECDGSPLNGPNDIVFDKEGGFWFTDLGKSRGRIKDRGALYYAKPDGSMITEAVFPLESPNGVGLSPDEKTVYVADTVPGRLWGFDIEKPGVIKKSDGPLPGNFVGAPQGLNFFDSLAVDAQGNVCVATIFNGGITSISPDGSKIEHFATGDFITTNICFGGKDLKTAYLTLSSTGRLVKCTWPRAGLPLNFHNK